MAWILPAAQKKPTTLGLQNGQLAPCPNTPNCVSSQATKKQNWIAPISYLGERGKAHERLIKLLINDPKATIVTQTSEYIHAEFKAFIFIDDTEFYLPSDEPVIHVRSASRVGRSDLGANKRRVKSISAAFSSRQ